MTKCLHVYKDPTKKCKYTAVRNATLCRAHLFQKRHTIAEEPTEAKEEDVVSIVDNVDPPEERSDGGSSPHDDNINLCREFVFSCIDDYFKLQKQRSEYLESLAKPKAKSSGMDMGTMMSLGAVSLLPILLKHLNIGNLLNASDNVANASKMEQQQQSQTTIQGRTAPCFTATHNNFNTETEAHKVTQVHPDEASRATSDRADGVALE